MTVLFSCEKSSSVLIFWNGLQSLNLSDYSQDLALLLPKGFASDRLELSETIIGRGNGNREIP